MIKLGCNAMLRVAEKPPYPDKLDPRNWLDIADLVRQIRAWNLDVVDFQLFRGFQARDPAYLRGIKRLCQQCGLPIGFLGVGRGFVDTGFIDAQPVGVPLPPDELQRRIAEVEEGIDLAAFMGAPMIRLFGGAIPAATPDRDAMWDSVVRSYQAVCDYGAERGIFVGLHNHAPVIAPTGDDIIALLNAVERDNFTFILDTGWWQGSPGAGAMGQQQPETDFYACMEKTAPRATYVRAKIYKIDSGREEWLDYPRIIDMLRRINFNGNMTIVFEGRGNRVGDIEAIGMAVEYLRELLGDR